MHQAMRAFELFEPETVDETVRFCLMTRRAWFHGRSSWVFTKSAYAARFRRIELCIEY